MAIWLEKAITCRGDTWNCNPKESGCYCGDEGPQQTEFAIDDEIFAYTFFKCSVGDNFLNKTLKQEWWYKGEFRWECEWLLSETYPEGVCCWAWWQIGLVYGPGSGFIKTFVDEQYMGSTNDFIIPAGQGAIHEILRAQSNFFTGPFEPGHVDNVAEVWTKNSGDLAGLCWSALWEYPNTPQERKVQGDFGFNLEPEEEQQWTWWATIPDEPGGIYPLGIKTWSEHEDEPPWSLSSKVFILRKTLRKW